MKRVAPVLHWHGDTFDLPAGATHLASTPALRRPGLCLGHAGPGPPMPRRGDSARSRTVVHWPCPRDRAHARVEPRAAASGYAMLRTPAPGAPRELLADLVERGDRRRRGRSTIAPLRHW